MKKRLSFIIASLLTTNVALADPKTDEQHEEELNEILRILEGTEAKPEESEEEAEEEVEEDRPQRRRIRLETTPPPNTTQESRQSQFRTQLGEVENYEHVYLLNIPIGTEISFNEDFYLPPYRDGIILKSGNIQSRSPLYDNVLTTFCHFNINESGFVRRFKGQEDNTLEISSNYSTSDQFIDENEQIITLYQTTIYFEHEHIDSLRCLTTEKNAPLNIGDLNRETGNIMNFKFPEVIDI